MSKLASRILTVILAFILIEMAVLVGMIVHQLYRAFY